MPFRDIVGHQRAIEVLRRAATSGRVAQAYLLIGPPNIGKTMLAKEFAKALNCERTAAVSSAQTLDSCGLCHNCVRIEQENHLDFAVVRPAIRVETRDEPPEQDSPLPQPDPVQQQGPGLFGDQQELPTGTLHPSLGLNSGGFRTPTHRTSTRVGFWVEAPNAEILTEAVEDLRRRVCTTLSSGTRHRVLVIAEADRVQHSAVDRLLKTIEEPPAGTSFVLTSSNPAQVRETIVSRCQTIRLQPLNGAQLLDRLRERYPTEQERTLRAVTAMSGGRFGYALRLVNSPQVRTVRDELLELAASTAQAQLAECLVLAERLLDLNERWLAAHDARLLAGSSPMGEQADHLEVLRAKAIAELLERSPDRFKRLAMSQVLDLLQSWYRDLALLRVTPESELVLNSDWRQRLVQLAPLYTQGGLRFARRTIENTRRDLLRHNANLRLACETLLCKLIASRRRR